jgi:hypothetical protein
MSKDCRREDSYRVAQQWLVVQQLPVSYKLVVQQLLVSYRLVVQQLPVN